MDISSLPPFSYLAQPSRSRPGTWEIVQKTFTGRLSFHSYGYYATEATAREAVTLLTSMDTTPKKQNTRA